MVTIKNLALSLLSISQIRLSWKNEGTSTGDELIIERSDSPDSEYEEAGRVEDTQEYFVDSAPLTHRKYIPYYYRIHHADNTISASVYSPFTPDKYVLEQNRLIIRHLQRDVGKKSYYFRKKSTGVHCDCWNSDLRKSTVLDCQSCAGTGFKKGYADPVEIYVSYPPVSPNEIQVESVKFSVLMPNAWTGNYPLLYPGDVLVRVDDMEVFVIGDRVNVTGRLLYPSRQLFPLRGVEHGSVEYDLIGSIPQ